MIQCKKIEGEKGGCLMKMLEHNVAGLKTGKCIEKRTKKCSPVGPCLRAEPCKGGAESSTVF